MADKEFNFVKLYKKNYYENHQNQITICFGIIALGSVDQLGCTDKAKGKPDKVKQMKDLKK